MKPMIYRFRAVIDNEGGRAFIKIPFNVWDETGKKGNGKYLIPITKKMLSALEPEEEYEIEMEPIETIPIQAGFCGHCCVAMRWRHSAMRQGK